MAASFASHTLRRGPYLGGKSGNAAGPPAQEPRRQGPPFRILSARRPPCYPHPSMLGRRSRIFMARLADVPLPRLVRCSTLSEGGEGGGDDVVSSCWGLPAFSSHLWTRSWSHLPAAQELREAQRGPSRHKHALALSGGISAPPKKSERPCEGNQTKRLVALSVDCACALAGRRGTAPGRVLDIMPACSRDSGRGSGKGLRCHI